MDTPTIFETSDSFPSLQSQYQLPRKIVTIGGGSGTFPILSYIKHYDLDITAVVSMSDSGGSSRMLMDEFSRQLPLGDLRMSLVALSRNGDIWRDIFMHRFLPDENASPESSKGITGHSLGNLILKGLQDRHDGDLLRGIHDAEKLLDTAGHVLPVTLTQVELCADMEDGSVVCSETNIDRRGVSLKPLSPIRVIRLTPPDVPACRESIEAIRDAGMIIIGPGDLYTSILPNLLVSGIAEAIRESSATKVYICNLMTKHGETDYYSASVFVSEIMKYLGCSLDIAVIHDSQFSSHTLDVYEKELCFPVYPDIENLERLVNKVYIGSLAVGEDIVRHAADRVFSLLGTR